jgi:3',5'-cyclic AMP phosphodiesterase CpdA
VFAQDLELVTVTDTSFVLTWYTADGPAPAVPGRAAGRPGPVDAPGLVRYGTRPGRLDCVAAEWGGTTPYHYVEVTGLRPGVTYYYEAVSAGAVAVPRLMPRLAIPAGGLALPHEPAAGQADAALASLLVAGITDSASPGRVTTLVPPPGELLFTIALSNDLHAGETAGSLGAGLPAGTAQMPGLPPYPVVMAQAMTRDAAARGADVLVVAGDLTAAARPDEVTVSRALLDRFGTLTLTGRLSAGDYVVVRGDHDQPGISAAGQCDCLAADYQLPPGSLTVTEAGGLRLIGLDTAAPDAHSGVISESALAALQDVLAERPGQPTLVFGHHPVTGHATATAIDGPAAGLNRGVAARLEALYATAPGVFLHHSGHTHRNLRTASPAASGVEFLEVAATKEYPGGFALLSVYQGGYMVNFYKSSTDLARQWSQVSSWQYLGLFPAYALGTTADRNHVVHRDFSALSPLRHRTWWGQRPRSLRSDAATT